MDSPAQDPSAPAAARDDVASSAPALGAAPAGDHHRFGTVDAPEVAAALTRTLAGFGAASVLGGGLLAALSDRPMRRAFGQQSAMWGAINLAMAGAGAWRSHSHPAEADALRRTLLINAGLDVAYLAVGAHLAYHQVTFGTQLSPDAARGHGLAVMMQASGLLKLDLFHAWRLQG